MSMSTSRSRRSEGRPWPSRSGLASLRRAWASASESFRGSASLALISLYLSRLLMVSSSATATTIQLFSAPPRSCRCLGGPSASATARRPFRGSVAASCRARCRPAGRGRRRRLAVFGGQASQRRGCGVIARFVGFTIDKVREHSSPRPWAGRVEHRRGPDWDAGVAAGSSENASGRAPGRRPWSRGPPPSSRSSITSR